MDVNESDRVIWDFGICFVEVRYAHLIISHPEHERRHEDTDSDDDDSGIEMRIECGEGNGMGEIAIVSVSSGMYHGDGAR